MENHLKKGNLDDFKRYIDQITHFQEKEEGLIAEIYLNLSKLFFDNSDLFNSRIYLDKAINN